MPWEKSFDEDAVLEKAMNVFWEKGYEATSISMLLEATGIGRASLYNAYGGKQGLFIQSLLKYDAENRRATLSALEAMDKPLEAIRTLFNGLVEETINDTEKKGCLLVNTALELPAHDAKTQSIVNNGMGEFDAFLRRCLEVAQARDEVPSTLDVKGTAKSLLALIVAIRVLGRGVFGESDLRHLSAQADRLVA